MITLSKPCWADLAILGGKPAFTTPLNVGTPNVGDRRALYARLDDMLDRRWLSNDGQYVRELEHRIQGFLGVKHCMAVCNATVALEIAVRAAGLSGEVILPSFTFIATAHAVEWQGLTPVFCDVDPTTHCLDPRAVESAISPRTSGIIGVHTWGRPCAIDALTRIADERGLTLLFDAAHAFGCSHGQTMIGNFGLAEVFSFHATKLLNTFEGGAVATNDDALAAKIRLMRNFGFAGYDNVVSPGTNGKMNEASAAMGLTNLESIDEFIEANRRNYHAYERYLRDLPAFHMLPYDEVERSNFQYEIVELNDSALDLTRDQLIKILHAENVLARRYFFPGCHRMEPYRTRFPGAAALLPNTEQVASRVVALPTGAAVSEVDVETVCGILRTVVDNQRILCRRLSGATWPRSKE